MATPPKVLVGLQEPSLPDFSGSSGNARLKVCLACLWLEAQEKELVCKVEFDFKLQIRQLATEAEKKVDLKQLEVEAMKLSQSQSSRSSPVNSDHQRLSDNACRFDVSKNIVLVPTFR